MQKLTMPVLFQNKEDCCGCSACFAICTKDAIMMKPDEEGFLYPYIDDDKCITCYQCVRVCPLKTFRANLDK